MKKFKSNNLTYYSEKKFSDKFIKEIKKLFIDKDHSKNTQYKDKHGKCSIHKVKIEKQSYFLKKFIYVNKSQCLRLNLGITENKAMKYYKSSKKLEELKIKNVKGEAVFVYSKGLFNYECILVTNDYCIKNNGQTFRSYIEGKQMKIKHINKIVKDLFKMIENNFFYEDFHFENFLIIDEEIYYLDLDSGHQRYNEIKKNKKKIIELYKERIECEYKNKIILRKDRDLLINKINEVELKKLEN